MGTSFYSTTHAPSALGAYDKLASDMVGVSRHFLATPGNIKLIAYQSLLPKLCDCAIPLESLSTPGHVDFSKNGSNYIARIEQLYRIDTGKIKIRNINGCSKCRHESISELNGFSGRTLAAEMIEPDETLLTLVKQGDSIGMHRYIYQSGTATAFDDPVMTGKTAMDCAVYKMSQGIVDPREIEPRFHSFEREAILRKPARSILKSVAPSVPVIQEVKVHDQAQ
jgi:general secretion pathway protein E